MSDVQAQSCTMVFEGQGGPVGFGRGTCIISLQEVGGQTHLDYMSQAQVCGKLARAGSRLIDSVARKMADDFFKAFELLLCAEPAPSATAPATPRGAADTAGAARVSCDGQRPNTDAGTPGSAARRDPDGAQLPAAAVRVLQAVPAQSGAAGAVMVPGGWLGVAAACRCAATALGALLARRTRGSDRRLVHRRT